MDALASSMQRRVTEFVVSSPAFQKACNTAFDAIDMRGSGRVPVAHVGLAAACFFQDLSAAMDAYGIKVRKPSADEIKRLVAEAGYPDSSSVSRAEFESIYLRVLQHAAAVSATAAAQRYGLAVAIAFTAVVVAKRAIRSVPVLGTLTAPLLGLLPAPLLGPVLGVLAVYVRDGGDLRDVRNAIFPPKRGGEGGQFMSS